MKLLKSLVVAGSALLSLNAAAASNYQDWWWDASKDGMGINIGHQGNVVAMSWYHFGTDGKSSYVLFAGALDENGTLTGDLQSATGPAPGPAYNPSSVQHSVAGTGKLHFVSDTSATFEYTINGVKGSMNLTRFSMGDLAPEGKYKFFGEYLRGGCAVASNNRTTPGTVMNTGKVVNNGGGNYVVSMGGCDYTLHLTHAGSVLSGSGTFTCGSSGGQGTATFERMRVLEDHLSIKYTAQYNLPIGCTETGTMGGIRSDSTNSISF